MRNLSIVGVFVIFIVSLCAASLHAADKKLGKIFIKAASSDVNGQQFPDTALEDTVKDMKKRPGKFILSDSESEADFLLVVVERKAVAVSGQPASKTILATLSVRDGAAWKPATKLQSGVRNVIWSVASDQVIRQAEVWVKANRVADPQGQPEQSCSVSDDGVRPRDYAASVQGKYVRKGKSSDFVELNPDGTFSLFQDGKSVGGNYNVQGDTLIVTSPRFKRPGKGCFIGDTIKDDQGIVWEKQAEQQKSAAASLTIDQIIHMVTAKLPDDIIITTIQKSSSKFDLTPEALIKLKTVGVSDAVMLTMMRKN